VERGRYSSKGEDGARKGLPSSETEKWGRGHLSTLITGGPLIRQEEGGLRVFKQEKSVGSPHHCNVPPRRRNAVEKGGKALIKKEKKALLTSKRSPAGKPWKKIEVRILRRGDV